jgi:enoyl-CoA hydratase/carnithine racemase
VSEVVQDEVLEARTLELARALAAKAPNAVSAAKMLMRTGLDSTLRQALTDAGIWAMWNGTQPDKDEGMAAFKERREPRFTGAARLSEHGHDG